MKKKSNKPGNVIRNDPPAVKKSLIRSLANNTFMHIACLVFLVLVIYANILNAPFQWDETTFIVNNPIIKDLHYFSNPSDAKGFELYSAFINRYIGCLTFALNYRIHGLSVTGYHIVNIAIHIANAVLVYFFVLLTFRTPFMEDRGQVSGDTRRYIAFFSSLLFAVHPLQTEAVTYVFQRYASLVTFFYLLSLATYIKARLMANDKGQKGKDKFRRICFYSVALISAVLAMKTKENAFTLPFIITLYEFCFFTVPRPASPRQWVTRIVYLAPILLTLAIIPLTLMSLTGVHRLDPGVYGSREFSRAEYFFTQFRVIVTYLRLLFFPVNQNISYDYHVFKSFFEPQVLLSFIFLTALFGLGVHLVKQAKVKVKVFRLMGFGILWFFISLSIESSIIPLPLLIDEYRVYLPSVGLITCVVAGLFLLKEKINSPKSGSIILAMLALAMVVLSVTTHLRNEVWTDRLRLWEDTVKKSPRKVAVHLGLGYYYQHLNMLDKAEEEFLTAVKLQPDIAGAHNDLGYIYAQKKLYDRAIAEFMIASSLNPDDPIAHDGLGIIYQTLNMPDKAMEQYLIAIKLKPDFAQAHNNLGLLYQQALNMPDKAMEQYLIAIKLVPDFAQAHNNLGIIYQIINMPDKAMEQYLIAIKLMPGYANAHFNLGFAYYKMGQIENAGRELITGLNIKPDNQQARQLLETITR